MTELSWPAAQGKTEQHGDFETTEAGQARRLEEGLPLLAERRKQYGSSACTGTRGSRPRASPAARSTTPGLRRLRSRRAASTRPRSRSSAALARRLQGCAKQVGDARRCRVGVRLRRACGTSGGYGAVLAERPIRRLLLASLCRPRRVRACCRSGFVLFAVGRDRLGGDCGRADRRVRGDERARAGARADRGPPRAGCAGGVRAAVRGVGGRSWWLVGSADGPRVVLRGARRARGSVRAAARPVHAVGVERRCASAASCCSARYALDSAGEESALIVSPLLVSALVAVALPRPGADVCGGGAARGSGRRPGARRSPREPLSLRPAGRVAADPGRAVAGLRRARADGRGAGRDRHRGARRPRASRAPGGGGRAAGGDGGRHRHRQPAGGARWAFGSPQRRVVALQAVMARRRRRLRQLSATHSRCSARRWSCPGALLGALFASLYLLVDRLAPEGVGYAHVRVAGHGQQRRAGAGCRGRGGVERGVGARRGPVVRRGLRSGRRRAGDRRADYVRARTHTAVRCRERVEYLPTNGAFGATQGNAQRGGVMSHSKLLRRGLSPRGQKRSLNPPIGMGRIAPAVYTLARTRVEPIYSTHGSRSPIHGAAASPSCPRSSGSPRHPTGTSPGCCWSCSPWR